VIVLAAIWGCAEPGTLGPVREVLAGDLVETAGPGLRLAVAVNGVVAETCGLVELDGYTFVGAPAMALGAVAAAVTRDEATGVVRWDLGDVGLEGVLGRLRVVTDTARSGVEVEWSGDAGVLTGALRDRCGEDGLAAVSGTLTWQHAGLRDALVFTGEPPHAGLAWDLPPQSMPTSGTARWARDEDPRTLELIDAAEVDSATWPGRARGPGWAADVGVDLGF
jgi:hypothetical protein